MTPRYSRNRTCCFMRVKSMWMFSTKASEILRSSDPAEARPRHFSCGWCCYTLANITTRGSLGSSGAEGVWILWIPTVTMRSEWISINQKKQAKNLSRRPGFNIQISDASKRASIRIQICTQAGVHVPGKQAVDRAQTRRLGKAHPYVR